MGRSNRPGVPYKLNPELKKRTIWFRQKLRKWSQTNLRDFPWREPHRNPYEVLIAEILLRRTQASTVAPIYNFFIKKYPRFTSLANASKRDLQKVLKPLGLWRQKASIFIEIAQIV